MSNQKSAFIAILGRANVGKSTLVNKLVGQKIAITSNKPQTTRTKILGVLTDNETQFVFIDTPGFHKPHNILGDSMIKAVYDGMSNVDAAILTVDAVPHFTVNKDNIPKAELSLIDKLKEKKIPVILVINKIDLLKEKDALLELISAYSDLYDFRAVIPLSAKTGDGIDILKNELKNYAKESVHYFSSDDSSDQADETIISEFIREKILRRLDREVPHGVAVLIEKLYETDTKEGEPIIHVEAVIYCEKDSHKGIIIGKGGNTLKSIGIDARKDIERFYGIKASVKLWVKVKEDWRNRQNIIQSFGLFNK